MRKKEHLMYKCPDCHYIYPPTMEKCPVCSKSAESLTPQPVSKLERSREIMMRGLKGTEADFILPIVGRGMVPYVDDGQSVYIKSTSDLEPGDVCLVQLEDGRKVIRIRR